MPWKRQHQAFGFINLLQVDKVECSVSLSSFLSVLEILAKSFGGL